MGFSAFDGGSGNATTVVEAFDLPADSEGSVEFDADAYEVVSTVTIRVRDIDLDGSGSVTIPIISSGGDSENVTLFDLGAGIFEGAIDTVSGGGATGDSLLQVDVGDILTVTYNDADDGTGNPAVVMDQATVVPDSTGPQILSHSPTGLVPGPVSSILITFNEGMDAGSFTSGDVLVTDPVGSVVALAGDPTDTGDQQSFTITLATPQTLSGSYTLVVGPDVLDLAGNPMNQDGDSTPGETNGDDSYTGSFGLGPPAAQAFPYSEGFESGDINSLSGWSFATSGGGTIELTGADNPHSGGFHLKFDQTVIGVSTQEAVLALDLSGQVGAEDLELDFWLKQLLTTSSNMLELSVCGDRVSWSGDAGVPNPASLNQYTHYAFDLDELLTAAGVVLDSDVYLRFRHHGTAAGRVMTLDDVRVNHAAPTVIDVLLSGTVWNTSFLDYLKTAGLGDDGYSIPAGSGEQLRTAPWLDIDQIKVVFSEEVSVVQSDLSLMGVNVPSFTFSGLATGPGPDPGTFQATWTLQNPIQADKLLIALPDTLEDLAGNALDGEWDNPTDLVDPTSDTYPSGNGASGGAFEFRFDVLPGDANGDGIVGASDYTQWANNFGQPLDIDVIKVNFNADGSVSAADYTIWANNFGTSLPGGEPMAASASGEAFSLFPATTVSSDSSDEITKPAADLTAATDLVLEMTSPMNRSAVAFAREYLSPGAGRSDFHAPHSSADDRQTPSRVIPTKLHDINRTKFQRSSLQFHEVDAVFGQLRDPLSYTRSTASRLRASDDSWNSLLEELFGNWEP